MVASDMLSESARLKIARARKVPQNISEPDFENIGELLFRQARCYDTKPYLVYYDVAGTRTEFAFKDFFTLDQPAHVTLRIFNALGDLIQTPTNEDMGAGSHMLMLSTKSFASGTYEYVLQAGSSVLKRSVLVVR